MDLIDLGLLPDLPDRIPSMHAFMLRVLSGTGGNLTIKYDQLVKNTKVNRGDGKYTVEFSLSAQLKNAVIYLHDLTAGTKARVTDGGSYTFEAVKGASPARFRLTNAGNDGSLSDDEALINVSSPESGKLSINNQSGKACTVFISDTDGKLLQKLEVEAGSERVVENLTGGVYVVRLQNAAVNDVRKVTME